MPRWSALVLASVLASGCCFDGLSGVVPGLNGQQGPVPGVNVPGVNVPGVNIPGVTPGVAPGAAGATFDLAPGFQPDPRTLAGVLGGPVNASTMNPSCRGTIPEAPTAILNVTAPFNNLRILAAAQNGDATLVVQLADGTFRCNDDTEGRNPVVEGPFPAGQHRVWVGTWSASGNGSPFTFGVTEAPGVMPSSLLTGAAAVQPAAAQPAAGAFNNGQPIVHTGRLQAGDQTLNSGEWSDQYTFQGTAGQTVDISVVSAEFDTYVILRSPSGQQQDNDDANGTNAGLNVTLAETGQYTVLATSYSPGQGGAYVLTIR